MIDHENELKSVVFDHARSTNLEFLGAHESIEGLIHEFYEIHIASL